MKENTKAWLINLCYDVFNLEFLFITLFIIMGLCIAVLFSNRIELNREMAAIQQNIHEQDKRILEYKQDAEKARAIINEYKNLKPVVHNLKYYSKDKGEAIFGKH